MDNSKIKKQFQNVNDAEADRILAARKIASKNTDENAKKLVKAQKALTDEIEETLDRINLQKKSYSEIEDKISSIKEKMASATEEQKKQYELELKSNEARKESIQESLEYNKVASEAKQNSLEELKHLKETGNIDKQRLEDAEKRLKLAELEAEQKERENELASKLEESSKRYKESSLENYYKVSDELKKQKAEAEELEKQYTKLSTEDKESEHGKAIKEKKDSLNAVISKAEEKKNSIFNKLTSSDKSKALGEKDLKGTIGDLTGELKSGFKNVFSSLGNVATAITAFVSVSRKFFNKMVDSAVNTVTQVYGPIAASLEGVNGSIKDFRSLNSRIQLDVGLSSMIKQETLLGNINELVKQGITSDIESLGILTSIRDKTVSSFNVTDANLRRLVRLNQQRGNLTAKQFGLADALKESFNATFGDHTYLNDMFQSITGTVLDAVSANANSGGTDSTAFYSVLESWLGAMYESGVDQGTINTIAKGVNYLGSGNVSGLASDKSLQTLMLLSMDKAGLDYADILQRGLSNGDMNKLLSTIVDYLAEITSTTKENNVLQSSYANLFNLSITDMTAIQNLSKMKYSALGMTGGDAQGQALKEINNVSSRTSMAEKINNMVENAQFSFGSSIAGNKVSYFLYKTSNVVLDMLDSIGKQVQGESQSKVAKAIKPLYDMVAAPTRIVTSVAYLASLLPGALGFGKSLLGSASSLLNFDGNNALAEVIASGSSGGMFDGGSSVAGTLSLTGPTTGGKSNKLKQFEFDTVSKSSGITDTSKWQNEAEKAADEDDESTKILKEFEKTLMKAKDKDGYAFAVSLQGMSDGVLRSLASIFADEEAMMNTMTGQNNALEKNNTFIDYLEDSSKKTGGAAGTVSNAVSSGLSTAKKV